MKRFVRFTVLLVEKFIISRGTLVSGANRSRLASSALAATAAMHAALCFFQWPFWQVLLQ